MRFLVASVLAVVLLALVAPRGCQGTRERVLLTLVRESERPVTVAGADQPTFRFPPTAVRAVAIIDYEDATTAAAHVSFLPDAGSDRYAWALGLCDTWVPACLEGRPTVTLEALTYGEVPAGLRQIEPGAGAARPLVAGRLYGLALFGEKLFALKAFYHDGRAIHVMEGARFAEAVVSGRRDEIAAFVGRR